MIERIITVAKEIMPIGRGIPEHELNYPSEIRELIKERRKARRVWHRSRNGIDKRKYNQTNNLAHQKIKEFKQNCLEKYVSELSPDADKDYSLWKATRKIKRPIHRVALSKNMQNQWVKSNNEKAELFA